MEEDLHGGGLDARGVSFPGLGFYLQIGRGPDYAWSATSASSDVTDQFAETLCGGDNVHYLYKGVCTAMGTFDAGTLKGQNGAPDTELTFRTDDHGPVVAYATSNGVNVALALARSTRGRELLGAIPFQKMSTGAVAFAAGVLQDDGRLRADVQLVLRRLEAHRDVLERPLAAARSRVNPGLPANGDGSHEWRGWLAPMAHPHVVDPASGEIVNWNNKPAAGFAAADDNFSYGSVHRVQLLTSRRRGDESAHAGDRRRRDERWPRRRICAATLIGRLLADAMPHGAAPSPRDAQMLRLLGDWDGSRLDYASRREDRRVGARRSWTRGGRGSRCGAPDTARPARRRAEALAPISNDANSAGSSYGVGLVLVRRGGAAGRSARARAAGRADARSPAATARRRRARRSSGHRSTTPGTRSPPRRAPIRPPGTRTRPPSASDSRASSPTRCAGRTARPSSK